MKEIHFTDGSVRTIYPNGEEETQMPDGIRVKLRAGDSSSAVASSVETATVAAAADLSANTSEPLNTPRPSTAALLSPSQQLVERIYEFPDGQREVHTAEFKVPLNLSLSFLLAVSRVYNKRVSLESSLPTQYTSIFCHLHSCDYDVFRAILSL